MIDPTRLPKHLAIIMDGNGRWAASRGLPRILGHRAGAEAVRGIVEACWDLGIQSLTLYAFSWENRGRPAGEIHELMDLLAEFILGERETLLEHDIRLRAMGRLSELPAQLLTRLNGLIEDTSTYTRMTLTLALSYGGRQEIVDAARELARLAQAGQLRPEQIDEARFAQALYLPDLTDPDLLIRTSGEQRISNFLLWQISYSELYMTATLWPDFGKDDLVEAIEAYQQRDRRFGQTHVAR